jgi:hypothetical protein
MRRRFYIIVPPTTGRVVVTSQFSHASELLATVFTGEIPRSDWLLNCERVAK